MFSSQSNEETVNGNGKQTEPLLNSNISVSEAIQKPSFRRQASASTFLCPDYIPGMLYIYICLKVIYPKYYIPTLILYLLRDVRSRKLGEGCSHPPPRFWSYQIFRPSTSLLTLVCFSLFCFLKVQFNAKEKKFLRLNHLYNVQKFCFLSIKSRIVLTLAKLQKYSVLL